MEAQTEVILIYASSVLALVWAVFNAYSITQIKLSVSGDDDNEANYQSLTDTNVATLLKIGEKISNGANSFLYQEYYIMSIFIVIFSIVVFLIVDVYGQTKYTGVRFYATASFIIGSITSILCGFIGMRIAVVSNYRTTYKAKSSLAEAFKVAYRAGCVMGFSSVGISLIILLTIILVYNLLLVMDSEGHVWLSSEESEVVFILRLPMLELTLSERSSKDLRRTLLTTQQLLQTMSVITSGTSLVWDLISSALSLNPPAPLLSSWQTPLIFPQKNIYSSL
jgi:hypothetical protein